MVSSSCTREKLTRLVPPFLSSPSLCTGQESLASLLHSRMAKSVHTLEPSPISARPTSPPPLHFLLFSADDARRNTLSTLTAYREQLIQESDPTEPAWVMEHMFEKKRRELEERGRELEERLEQVRRKEKQKRRDEARTGGLGDGREKKRMVS